ncbi:MAG: hypothetical protein AAF351_11955 [Pseudomonadota bacterium]
MTEQPSADAVIEAFCMEPTQSTAELRQYIEKYPQYAEDLLDVFHDLELSKLSVNRADSDAVQAPLLDVHQASTFVAEALSGDRLRTLASNQGLPRDFFVGFRDARIRLGSVPAALVSVLSDVMGVRLRDFVVHLQSPEKEMVTAFRSEQKPEAPRLLEYDAFVSALELTQAEATRLQELVSGRGSD